MSPLVALLLFGFMFVIALSLTIWAALTLGDSRQRQEDERDRVDYVPFGTTRPVWREDASETRVVGFERRAADSKASTARRRGDEQLERRTGLPPVPVGQSETNDPRARPRVIITSASAADNSTTSAAPADGKRDDDKRNDERRNDERRNDEFRGARARVTQRPNHDDAFERFLDNERD